MLFHKPSRIEDAIQHLNADGEARCLSGGATLVAMMNADLVRPSALVSLSGLPDMADIRRQDDGSIWIGAMARHQVVADTEGIWTGAQRVIPEAAGVIGYPAVRNMGTIGGSICHADPAADYPPALLVTGATMTISGPEGSRQVGVDDFFLDYFETAVEQGELVVSVTIPAASAASAGCYEKFARTKGDFATVSAAAALEMDGDRCARIRVAVGGCGPTAIRVPAAEERLVGSDLHEQAVREACAMIAEQCDPIDDVRGSAEYRLKLLPVLVRRAIDRCLAQLGS